MRSDKIAFNLMPNFGKSINYQKQSKDTCSFYFIYYFCSLLISTIERYKNYFITILKISIECMMKFVTRLLGCHSEKTKHMILDRDNWNITFAIVIVHIVIKCNVHLLSSYLDFVNSVFECKLLGHELWSSEKTIARPRIMIVV